MFGRKFQVVTQIVGTITLAFLAVYGLLALLENGAAAWAQAPEVTDVPSSAPSLESSEVNVSVPLVMNYQGDVKDAEGNALDGSYNMTFRIYADLVAGSALWEEQHQNVTVRAGHFSVLLGNTTPLPETLFDESDRFIGVTVDPYEEMVPRQRFASVPYAMHADHATDADHADEATHASQADNASQAERAFGLNAEDGNPQDAVIVDAEGNVGIGTSSLPANLHVAGDVNFTGGLYRNGSTYIPPGITVIGQTLSMNSAQPNSANHILASRWMARATTKIKKLGMAIYSGAADCDIVMGIYNEDSSQLPDQLLGVTSPRTLSSTDYDQENLFALTSAVSITEGQYYWIAWNGKCTMNLWDADPSGRAKQGRWAHHTYNGTLPTFFHSGGGGTPWVRKAVFGISGE